MEEMRQLIGHRSGVVPQKSRPRSIVQASSSSGSLNAADLQKWQKVVVELTSDVERDLTRAASNHELMQNDLKQFASGKKDVRIIF